MWEEPGSLKEKRLEVWARDLTAAEISIDHGMLEGAHDAAHATYEMAWRAGRQFTVEDAARLVMGLVGDASRDGEELLLAGYSEAGRLAAVHASSGVRKCLDRLRESGVALGIVCDIGLTPSSVVRELLDRECLLELFDDTTFSDKVGHYKPSPAIFEHALGRLGHVPPRHAAHVGDRRRTDVAGAQALGMTAVRYTGVFDDASMEGIEAELVVDRLATLPEALKALKGGG
jgi:FMN phosphatase YigB (HAD superfamily)